MCLTPSHAPHMCSGSRGIQTMWQRWYHLLNCIRIKDKTRNNKNPTQTWICSRFKHVSLWWNRSSSMSNAFISYLAAVSAVSVNGFHHSPLPPQAPAGPFCPGWGMGTTEATLRMENMEVKDEWQDEDFPRSGSTLCLFARVFLCVLGGWRWNLLLTNTFVLKAQCVWLHSMEMLLLNNLQSSL